LGETALLVGSNFNLVAAPRPRELNALLGNLDLTMTVDMMMFIPKQCCANDCLPG
jgi:hypothetical protein